MCIPFLFGIAETRSSAIFSQGGPLSADCRSSSNAASLGRTRVAQPFIVWNSACGISPATFTQSRRPDAATRVWVWIGGFEALRANASVADGSKKTQEWKIS
jgi:hypothetical protein